MKSEQEHAATNERSADDAIDCSGCFKFIVHSFFVVSAVRGTNQWNCASTFDSCKSGFMEKKSEVAVTAEDSEIEFPALRSKQFAVRNAEFN